MSRHAGFEHERDAFFVAFDKERGIGERPALPPEGQQKLVAKLLSWQ